MCTKCCALKMIEMAEGMYVKMELLKIFPTKKDLHIYCDCYKLVS